MANVVTDRTESASERGESKRLNGVYSGYASNRRKSRFWSPENPGNAAIRAALLERVLATAEDKLRAGGEILDIGCGSGWWLEIFRNQGVEPRRLHGIDAIERQIHKARARLPASDLRVGDIRELPYANECFAFVLFVSVLSDLQTQADVELALQEAVRVLASGGLMICYEPRMPNPFNRNVRRIPKRNFDRVLGKRWNGTALTVLPPLSFRLGSRASKLYPALARFRPLLTHRFVEYRKWQWDE
jgi:ubiquinone/menaquinone biosynthesis C-methylase UbiE